MAVSHASETYDAAPKEAPPSVVINMDSVIDHIPYDREEELPVGFVEFLDTQTALGQVRLWTANEQAMAHLWNWLLEQYAYETKKDTIVGAVTMETSEEKPEGALDFVPAPPAAPVNVDAPYISPEDAGVGDTLGCTMGNWHGAPTEYAYQWTGNGITVATGIENTYTVTAAEAGKTINCIVTATNAIGSTQSPPSNDVAVPGGTTQSSSRTKK